MRELIINNPISAIIISFVCGIALTAIGFVIYFLLIEKEGNNEIKLYRDENF